MRWGADASPTMPSQVDAQPGPRHSEAPERLGPRSTAAERETVWLTWQQMADLFGRERSVVTKHIRCVLGEGELKPEATRARLAHTAADGKTYQVDHSASTLGPATA
jgi:hypothetical protein